jgi:hypothetical protein
MISYFKTTVLHLALAVLVPCISLAQSKQASAPAAPVPAQILTAKKIFIANAGGDEMAEGDPIFSGGPDRAYNQFYTAMKLWGRFQIVDSPAPADLLLEIRQDVSAVNPSSKGGSTFIPQFRLKIRDPKTNALLWGFDVHSEFGVGQSSSDHNFDQAVDRLVSNFRALVAQPEPASGSANTP